MPRDTFDTLRSHIDNGTYVPEDKLLERLKLEAGLSADERAKISARAAKLVRDIRGSAKPGLMEVFLAEYGLSTNEGVALMCLAEALLRVPDASTIDALIEDKIAPSDWGKHLGHSSSSLVNASTWALMLTGKVLEEDSPGVAGALRGAVKRLGEPVIRKAVGRAMKEMGRQFVLGEDITAAMHRARGMESKGYTYSYDMLGEAARTEADALRYEASYTKAIAAISAACTRGDVRANPGISVKLSALHPRYEFAQKSRVMDELVPRVRDLAMLAANAGMGFNIDAEEADRLGISLDVIEAVLADPGLSGWDGFGVVVQAFGRRAGNVIDWLYALAEQHDRRLMVRLVKGAYWDTEVKRAQVMGLPDYPVFTRKQATDISYISCSRKLLGMTDRIYPQFATHNAHTVAAVLEMAGNRSSFEFQRLHGMGERLHDIVLTKEKSRCRIYAPVGAHRDLLAYLVRRLLENGANSSFVNQIVNDEISPETVAADPFENLPPDRLPKGTEIFRPQRQNSRGWDLTDPPTLAAIEAARGAYRTMKFEAFPLLARSAAPGEALAIRNPADPSDLVGHVRPASEDTARLALAAAQPWEASVLERGGVLNRAAEMLEDDYGALFAILAREAGKSLLDAVGEVREAVDFLRYYAAEAGNLDAPARGTFVCISPWNFPLAIFCGQVAGALAAGNAVVAKPAEQTPLIAHRAVEVLLRAGVPATALQFLPGDGAVVGRALTSDPRCDGVAFTGSTETAKAIRRSMAAHLSPEAPLIAETGGINAMIVDSTALAEQAVRDILASSFQSAGQRCSALRCLYVQEDIAANLIHMLTGAMDTLAAGNPWNLSTDVGPVIDAEAAEGIMSYIEGARTAGRVIHETSVPQEGHFVAPTVVRVSGIADIEREIFGPVLHVATFRAQHIDRVIEAVNETGFGLTFGLHTRIDDRVQHVVERVHAGNIYVNRNQIGAVVGSQPFGGEGLSGTGPKAGGPQYLKRFTSEPRMQGESPDGIAPVPLTDVDRALAKAPAAPRKPQETLDLPGPTGESNRLSLWQKAPFLCLGPGEQAASRQAEAIRNAGGRAIELPRGILAETLVNVKGIGGVAYWGGDEEARTLISALAGRQGPILPLFVGEIPTYMVVSERHVCVDTTASGGNAQLLAEVSS